MSSKLWKDYSQAEKIKYFANKNEDCCFLVGMSGQEEPREFKGYKFVLSSVSPVFEKMFNGNFVEAKTVKPVEITDIFACDFEAFLDFVQLAKPNGTRWKQVYNVAKKYMADGIIKEIIERLESVNKLPSEALQLYDIQYLNGNNMSIYGNMGLLNETGKQIVKAINTGSIDLGADMDVETIRILLGELSLAQLHLHKGALFGAIASSQGILNAKELKLIINQFDFSEMSFKNYFSKVECSSFDEQIKHKILVDICRYNKARLFDMYNKEDLFINAK